MRKHPLYRRLPLLAAAGALFASAPTAYAHTTIRDAGKENTRLYTAATITHGCAAKEDDPTIPVIAQSMVFPNFTDSILTRLDTSQPIALTEVIDTATTWLPIGPNGIQDKNIFEKQKEVAESVEVAEPGKENKVIPVTRGFRFWKGNLRTDLIGIVPFRVDGIKFVTSSCVKNLLVRIAIANWCTRSQSEDEDNRVDAWIGKTTPAFDDTGVVSVGFWPTLTIARDLATNPLPEGCNGGFDVAIEPSNADIDRNLPIKGFWPAGN